MRKRFLYKNMLDSQGVIVTPSSEDATYKFWAAYDRDIGLPAMFGNANNCSLLIDQGAAGTLSADRLIIAGHNFNGMTLTLKASPDNVDWSNVLDTWVQAGSDTDQPGQNIINRTLPLAGQPYRYFRLSWDGNGSTIPQMTEIFLGPTYELERNPSYGDITRSWSDGVKVTDLHGGSEVYFDHWGGREKRHRKWGFSHVVAGMAANLNDLDASWAGRRPFFVEDDDQDGEADGTWFFARLLSRLEESAKGYNYSAYSMDVIEVLP